MTILKISTVTTEITGDTKTVLPVIEEDEKETNVWDDEGEAILTETGTFKAGTLNAIILKLTSDVAYGKVLSQ